ncbi:DNRLRE domain-containing protein [Candidatus Woesearchaeota archaeon]|nr:DNRLRE domain-containing protein [Candidatus Woesearchaeota archaeon]
MTRHSTLLVSLVFLLAFAGIGLVHLMIADASLTGSAILDSSPITVYDHQGKVLEWEVAPDSSLLSARSTDVLIAARDSSIIKKMRFKNLRSGNELRIDTLDPGRFEAKQGYAIDPSSLDFDEADVTVQAQGQSLYKCASWDFETQTCPETCEEEDGEEDCRQEWVFVQTLTPGEDYVITITATDPAFIETSEAIDVSMTPINETTFVVGWIDDTQQDASFRVMDTDGTVLVSTVDVDTTVDAQSRISVAALNASDFVVVYVDGPDDDLSGGIYDLSGTAVFGPGDVDTGVGTNTDVSIAAYGTGFILCNANDADNDADYRIYTNGGTQLVGESNVDANMGPGAVRQNLVGCAAVNSTRWSYVRFDDQSNDVTYRIFDGTTDTTGDVDLDTNVGETGQVDLAAFGDKFAYVFYDAADDDVTLAIRDAANTQILAPTDIDTTAGTSSRVAACAVQANRTNFEEYVAFAWYDQASNNIQAAVYDQSGTQVTAPFVVATNQDTTYRLIDVIGYDTILETGLCPGSFVVGYTNSSDQGVFKGFHVDGSSWDGTCPDIFPPEIVSFDDSPDPVEEGDVIVITASVTDDTALDTVLVEILGTNYSMSENITMAVDESYEAEENLSLSGGYETTTSCICASPSGGSCIRDADAYTASEFANVSFTSLLPTGIYNITYYHCPENDGDDIWKVYSDDVERDSYTTAGGEVWTSRTVADVPLANGEELVFGCSRGSASSYCRMDYFTIEAPGGEVTYVLDHNTTGESGTAQYTIFANDTSNNKDSETGSYQVLGGIVDFFDSLGEYVNATYVIGGTAGDLVNLTAFFEGAPNVQTINITNHNISAGQDKVGLEFSTNDDNAYSNTWSIDPSELSFAKLTVTFTAQGEQLFKCVDFNFTSQLCNDDGAYEKIANLTPSQNYTIAVNATDPAFGENFVGSADTRDAWFRGGNVNQNRGTVSNLRVGRTTGVNNIRTAIAFNLSSIPDVAIVNNALLELYFYNIPASDSTAAQNMAVHRIQQSPPRDWQETLVTWNTYDGTNSWTSAGGDFNATATDVVSISSADLNSFIAWNVTTDVQAFVQNSSLNFGWILKDNTESTNSIRRDFYSKEYSGNTSLLPRLTVNYTILDVTPPNVTALNVSDGLKDRAIPIAVNVVDDFAVDTVLANISGPSVTYLLPMTPLGGGGYAVNFTNTAVSGQYSVQILANDTDNNVNDSVAASFVIEEVVGFPSSDIGDGRHLAIVGTGLSTVPSTSVSVFSIFDQNTTDVRLLIYDGDSGGNFDYSTSGGTSITYLVYADPDLNFSTDTLLANVSSTSLPNADLAYIINQNHSSAALGPDSNYYYRLDVNLDDPSATLINTFKTFTPGTSGVFFPGTAFQFIGLDDDFITAGCTPYPGCGAGVNTTFFESGENFSFIIDVPPGTSNFTLTDDDADFDTDASSPGAPSVANVLYNVYGPNGSLVASNTDVSGNYPDEENFTVTVSSPGLYRVVWEDTNTLTGGGTNPNNILFKTPYRLGSSPPFYFIDMNVFKVALDDNDGNVTFGDNLTYVLSFQNVGNNTFNYSIVDPIPAGAVYVPGSLTLNGVGLSDAADADFGDFNVTTSNAIAIDANLTPGQNGNVTFKVHIPLATPSNTLIENQANVTYGNKTTVSDDPDTLLVDDPTSVLVVDEVPPSVFDIEPTAGSVVTVGTVVLLSANVTDNKGVGSVFAQVTLPNSTVLNIPLSNSVGDLYNGSVFVPLLGQYNVTLVATDTSGLINASESTYFTAVDNAPPSVFDLRPFAGSFVDIEGSVEIAANVTDNILVDTVSASVLFPNGTVQVLPLLPVDGDKYNATFVPPNLTGLYVVSFFANDSSNLINASETTNFNGFYNVDFINASSRNAAGDPIELTLTISQGASTVYSQTGEEFSFSIPNGVYNITLEPVDQSRARLVSLYNVNISSSFPLVGIDYTTNPYAQGFNVLGIDPTGLDFEYGTISRNATGVDLYKCPRWNYTLGTCGGLGCSDVDEDAGSCQVNGTWELLDSPLSVGQLYNITFTATDPGYSEYTESLGENSTTSTAYVNKTSLVFTPDQAGPHLVIVTAQLHGNSQTSSVLARVLVDGTNVSEVIWEPKDANIINDYQAYGTQLIQDFSVASHTLTLQWASETGDTTFIKNARLSVVQIDDGANASTVGPTSLTTAFTSIVSTSFTPPQQDEYLLFGSAEVQNGDCTESAGARLVLDGTDLDNQTYECKDTTDYKAIFFHAVANLSSASHTLSMEARRTGSAGGEIRNARVTAVRLTPDFDYHFAANDTEGTATCGGFCSTSFFNHTILTFTPVETAEYLILGTAEFNTGNQFSQASINMDIDGSAACEVIQEQRTNTVDDQLLFVCQDRLNLTAIPHVATISYAAKGFNPTTTIKNARITAIRVTPDEEPPSVFDLVPVAGTNFTWDAIIEIGANITDNIFVDYEQINLTYPNGTSVLLPLSFVVGDFYNVSFDPPTDGQYNVTFFANDSSANVNNTESTYFIVLPPPPPPIISVVKTDSSDPVLNGTLFNYTILISNTGNGTAGNVTVVDVLPSQFQFVSSSPAPTVPNSTWVLGNLSPSSSTSVELEVLVNASPGNFTNFANVSYDNVSGPILVSVNETTEVVEPTSNGIKCVLTQTPQVVEPGETVLFQADIAFFDGKLAQVTDVNGVGLSIYRVTNANATLVYSGNFSSLSDGIWFAEFVADQDADGNYLARADANTTALPLQTLSCSEVFTIHGRGVFSLEGISPDLVQINETVSLALQVLLNSAAVNASKLNNSQLVIDKVGGGYTATYNSSNGLSVSDGLLSLEGLFNETGVYLLNWSLEYYGRQKSAREIVVVSDWAQTPENGSVADLIEENKQLLIEALKEIEQSQDFAEEEVFLITDSINSMSRLASQLDEGELTPEEAKAALEEIQRGLRNAGAITGRVAEQPGGAVSLFDLLLPILVGLGLIGSIVLIDRLKRRTV